MFRSILAGIVSLHLVGAASALAPASAAPVSLAGYADDPSYGWMPETPITLGGYQGTQEERAAALFSLLKSADGRPLEWRFIDRCCPFVGSGDGAWERATDLYVIRAPDGRWRRLFINMFLDAPAHIPTGLSGHRSAADRRNYDSAVIEQTNEARLSRLARLAEDGALLARRQVLEAAPDARMAGLAVDALIEAGMAAHEPSAYTAASMRYLSGRGIPEKESEPVRLLREAARLGDAQARSMMGLILLYDENGPPEPGEAFLWLRLAAEVGHADAQAMYGRAYLLGRHGVDMDVERGALYLSLASEQGHEAAQRTLDTVFGPAETIEGGAAAFEAFTRRLATWREAWTNSLVPSEQVYRTRIAALEGDADAMTELARRLFNGITTDRDFLEAYFFASLAERHGGRGELMASRYAELAELTDAERAEVARRVRDWRPEFYR